MIALLQRAADRCRWSLGGVQASQTNAGRPQNTETPRAGIERPNIAEYQRIEIVELETQFTTFTACAQAKGTGTDHPLLLAFHHSFTQNLQSNKPTGAIDRLKRRFGCLRVLRRRSR